MPAIFPKKVKDQLSTVKGILSSSTTWAAAMTVLVDLIVGVANYFGTAATKDTGTANGTIPVLGTGGTVPAGQLPIATTTAKGIIQLATTTEVKAGKDAAKAVTSAGVKSALAASGTTIPAATESVSGTVELATPVEAKAGTDH